MMMTGCLLGDPWPWKVVMDAGWGWLRLKPHVMRVRSAWNSWSCE